MFVDIESDGIHPGTGQLEVEEIDVL